jgi:hypothetical protein
LRVGGLEAVEERLHLGDLHVAVVDLAEQVLDVLGQPHGGRRVGAEDRCGDLEDVAQALRRDPHVVQRDDLGRVGRLRHEPAQLVEAHADDPLGVVGQRLGRIEI